MGLAFKKKCRLEISLRAEPPDEAANQDAHLLPRAGLQRDSLLSLKASSISAHFSVAPIPSLHKVLDSPYQSIPSRKQFEPIMLVLTLHQTLIK